MYSHSLLHITQACRSFGLGKKFLTKNCLAGIGEHKGHFVLVRPIGVLEGSFHMLLDELFEASGRPVFIKKLTSSQVGLLRYRNKKSSLFMEPNEYPWDVVSPADDDTCPELLVSLERATNIDSDMQLWKSQFASRFQPGPNLHLKAIFGQHRQFRRRLRKSQASVGPVEIQAFNQGLSKEVWQFIANYFMQRPNSCLEAYRNMVFTDWDTVDPQKNLLCVVRSLRSGEILAFYAASLVGHETYGCYASLSRREKPNHSDFCFWKFMMYLQDHGAKWLCLGGSETLSLYKYKLRLAPVASQQMHMLIYNPMRHASS